MTIDTSPELQNKTTKKKSLLGRLFTTDHKQLGLNYMVMSLFFLFVGGALALILRMQLGWPGEKFSFLNFIPNATDGGVITPGFYNTAFTMHATFMIFFAVMPFLLGGFSNYLTPLKIGAREMAFPKINALAFWLAVISGIIMLWSFGVVKGAAATGWTAYPPLSAVPQLTDVALGQDLWIISLFISGISSILNAIVYLTTVINKRCEGMSWFRLPMTVWSIFITSILILLSIPVLVVAITLLFLDRNAGTSFFLPSAMMVGGQPLAGHTGGGQPLLWQHLFWFFGHPEVYIMILPAMGIVSDVLANFSRKPLFGYRAMVFSTSAIAILGFLVWGHHMFVSGMNPVLGTSFMVSTMFIAVPSAIKTVNWLGTLWRGNIQFKTPLLFAAGFVSLFVIGGLSGIYMASTPVDIYIHDTYFIVGHIHYVLFGGSIFAIFSGLYYWYPKMFGRMLNEKLGVVHFILTYLAFNGVFFPMHILGVRGMMRRIYDYTQYPHLSDLVGINRFMSISAFVLGAATLLFLFNFIWSRKRGVIAGNNPWSSTTLEWSVSSPPPEGNFTELPHVFRAPYEYGVPERSSDFWPQDEPPTSSQSSQFAVSR